MLDTVHSYIIAHEWIENKQSQIQTINMKPFSPMVCVIYSSVNVITVETHITKGKKSSANICYLRAHFCTYIQQYPKYHQEY